MFDAFDGTGNPFSEFDGTPKDAAGEAVKLRAAWVVESTTAKSSESQTASREAHRVMEPDIEWGLPDPETENEENERENSGTRKNFGEKVNLSEEEEDASGGNGSATS